MRQLALIVFAASLLAGCRTTGAAIQSMQPMPMGFQATPAPAATKSDCGCSKKEPVPFMPMHQTPEGTR